MTVNDGQSANNTVSRTFTVTVNAVNDAPTLDALSNVTINENAAAQTVEPERDQRGSGEEARR